jgi:hypothetical protein
MYSSFHFRGNNSSPSSLIADATTLLTAAMTKGVVARVLPRHCRHNRFREVIPDSLIGERVLIVFNVSVFAKFGRALPRLADVGYDSRKSE